MKSMLRAAALGLIVVSGAVLAQGKEDAFLSDYSGLKASPDNPFDELYIASGAVERLGQYNAVMIDQPELFVHPDSKYKGMKPDDMKAIADSLRPAITDELKGAYVVVDAPGPTVLYVRFAVGDLMLDKKKRPIMAYIPAGAVIYAAKNLASDATSKVKLAGMKLEGEVLDSRSLDQLAAMTASRGSLSTQASGTEPSWDELNGLCSLVGKRLRCRLDNARTSADRQANCGAIGLAPAE